MSPASGSVAVTAAPTSVPPGEFSSMLRDTVSAPKLGAAFTSAWGGIKTAMSPERTRPSSIQTAPLWPQPGKPPAYRMETSESAESGVNQTNHFRFWPFPSRATRESEPPVTLNRLSLITT